MRLHNPNKWLLFILPFVLFSCASRKDIVYMQGIDSAASYESTKTYEPKLQPDDLLSILVYAENPEVAAPFNLSQMQGNNANLNLYKDPQNYVIDASGFIDFPVIGKIKLAGMTSTEANKKLIELISDYIKNPTVNLKILNFKISVLGEVGRPGSYSVPSQRVSILEAISLAGDLSIYGKRNNILIIHDEDGKKTYNRVDITTPEFLKSPSFYLAQNDVVFVEPNRTKINSSVVGPNTTVILSIVSILISISVILIRN
jgi:polysaccharide export outer membrane protein